MTFFYKRLVPHDAYLLIANCFHTAFVRSELVFTPKILSKICKKPHAAKSLYINKKILVSKLI